MRDNAPAECGTITREIVVLDKEPPRPRATDGSVWPVRNAWNRATENLYSAWIEKLFDAPLDATLSWPALHEVLRDRVAQFPVQPSGSQRRHDEDWSFAPTAPTFRTSCAPISRSRWGCRSATRSARAAAPAQPPKCFAWWNIQNLEPPPTPPEDDAAPPAPATTSSTTTTSSPLDFFRQPAARPPAGVAAIPPGGAPKAPGAAAKPKGPPPKPAGLAPAFGWYLRIVADAVHSGAGRTALADDNTDFYPVSLNEDTLRPGTVYADPYGHLLVLVRRVPQTDDAAGVILAVDAQPDGTVARKRFWRGNFLFAQDPALGGPGFKRFRPIVRDKNGTLRRLTNADIAKNPQYGDFSLDQGATRDRSFLRSNG